MTRHLRLTGIALCAAIAACVTTPLDQREWVAIRTGHYDVWSSLEGDASQKVAVELERFRAATEFVWGSALAREAVRTRVFAFDDRGVGRPFAFGPERSYLLARQRGDVIVLRTGDGWEGDARIPLKLEYARRLIANSTPEPLPPWIEEGLAQVASTLEIRGDGATVGIPHSDHIRTLRESQWVSFERLFAARELGSWSSLERSLFEAEVWALCHYLSFHAERREGAGRAFARFRERLGAGVAPGDAAREAFGDPAGLQRATWRHVRADELDSLAVRIPWAGPRPTTTSVSPQTINEELGFLAVAIDERDRAAHFLENALEEDAASPRALGGLAEVLAAQGDRAAADARYAAALAGAPDDPLLHLGWANLLRLHAEAAAEPAERALLVSRAREHYARAIALDAAVPEPHAGLAATYLVSGEDPSGARESAAAARDRLPGDPAIRALGARIALALGDRESARREAMHLMTRARSGPELDAARALLERIDSSASVH